MAVLCDLPNYKLATHHILSSRRLEQLKHVRVSELKNSIENLYLYEKWREDRNGEGKVLVDIGKWFGELDMNIILRMVSGKRYSGVTCGDEKEMDRFRKVTREFIDFFELFVMADALPYLGWLDLGGHEKAMKSVFEEIDCIFGKWLDEHITKRGSVEDIVEKDFIDVMLLAADAGAFAEYDVNAVIKSTCLDIVASSADTMTVMLTWALSLLSNNPDVLQKAKEEIDRTVGKEKHVDDSDINKLVYLQAIIKETLRLYPAAPIGAPRQFSEDCVVGGYNVPKDTWLIVKVKPNRVST